MKVVTPRKKGAKSPRRVQVDFSKAPSRAKQEFKKECDINNILAKFRRTGAITHLRRHAPQFGIANGVTFAEAARVVAEGNSMYTELPSHIKSQFKGPQDFLEFVSNPENEDKVRELFGVDPAEVIAEKEESDKGVSPPPEEPSATAEPADGEAE